MIAFSPSEDLYIDLASMVFTPQGKISRGLRALSRMILL